MEMNEIKQLLIQVSKMIEGFEERGNKVVQTNLQATQSINQTVQNAATTSERVTQQSLQNLRDLSEKALLEGIREPLKDCDKTLIKVRIAIFVD